jgi:hypothetical protein
MCRTDYRRDESTLNANEELSAMERDELLQGCRQRLDMFRVEEGNPQRLAAAKERKAIRS